MQLSQLIALCVFVFAQPVAAQDARGQIQGRVVDPSGAAVQGVTVRAVNTGTNVASLGETNQTGDYVLSFLLPGVYNLAVESAGFKKWIREGVGVQVNDRITLNVALELGAATESIRVVGETPLVDAASASLGTVVDQRRVLELPLKDGNPIMLSSLSPGVMNLSTGGWSRPFDNASPSAIAISGNRSGTHEFTLDGAPNTTGGGGNVAFIPPTGVVEEFKIQTATFDANNGFASGAVVNVSLRSGTNDLHGQFYEFLQNPVLNANSYFNNLSRQPRANIRQHRYGVSASGPVWIPKLYNGRNKTFWMYGYEGITDTFPRQTTTASVPSQAHRAGDFSQLLRVSQQYQIYDPATIAAAPNGRFSRQPLPGNVIPASRIAAVAANLSKFWPQPNLPGTADGSNNYTVLVTDIDDFWSHVFRVDHNLSEKSRFFIRGDANRRKSLTENRYNNEAYGTLYFRRNKGGGFDHVYVFRPNLLLNSRYSYTKYYDNTDPRSLGADLAGLGFSPGFANQVNSIDPRAVALPHINVGGYAPLSPSAVAKASRDIHSLAANVTHFVRNHSLKYGYELRAYRDFNANLGMMSGRFDYGIDWTRGPLDTSPGAPMGQTMASFLLGHPTGGFVDYNDSYAQQILVSGAYFQDDWKLSPKLTLTLGIRYELAMPTTERFNRTVRGFDFSSPSPIEGQVRARYAQSPIPEIIPANFRVRGGLTFAGANGEPRGLWNADRNNWSPRIGVAYQLNTKTALRAGFGRFFDLDRQTVNQAGFSRRTLLVPSLNNGQTFVAGTASPYPSGIDRPLGASQGLMTFAGQGVGYFNSNLLTPYAFRWQFSLQRELLKDMALEAAYVGASSENLRIGRAMNPVPREYLSNSLTRDQTAINFLAQQFQNPFFPLLPNTNLAATTVARSQLLRPYPQYTGIAVINNDGYSNYHSLQTRLEKRFSASYTVMAAYTWSKFMEGTGYLNEVDAVPEYVVSDQDRTHRLVLSGIWEFPFGKGKRFAGSAKGLAEKLIGGWQAQGIFQGQSGAPLGFGNAIFLGDLKAVPIPKNQRSIYRWFNTAAGFELAPGRQLGSNIRYMPSRFTGIRSDGINNWDLSVIKNTYFNERIYLQFRAEFLNAFNHTQFSPPNTNPSSTAFGTVNETAQMPRLMQFGLKLFF